MIILAGLTVWVFSTTAAHSQTIKAPFALTGRVMDLAGMISAEGEKSLTARLAAHEARSGNQVVAVTVPTLNGESLEIYSLKLARGWQLGRRGVDNGVLLLVAKKERKLRIEVGYGLEGTLTDAISSIIIRETITPSFKQGKFDVGIRAGVSQILNVLEADKVALERWKERAKNDSYEDTEPGELIFFAIFTVWFFLFFGSWIMGWLATRFGRKIKPGHYRWLGFDGGPNAPKRKTSRHSHYGGSSGTGGFGGGFGGGSSGGGFSGGGGGFGGGGSSGSW